MLQQNPATCPGVNAARKQPLSPRSSARTRENWHGIRIHARSRRHRQHVAGWHQKLVCIENGQVCILDSQVFEEFPAKPGDSLQAQESPLINSSPVQLTPSSLNSLGQHLELELGLGTGAGVVSGPLVSNWFANARRRLKNTVRQPDLSWALRIKLYNKYVQGNAERLSVSSDDSCSEGVQIGDEGYTNNIAPLITAGSPNTLTSLDTAQAASRCCRDK
ncbi:hypothetical protein F2P81_019468 [Scophthalmus maximus]|uniref:Homeobox domain-containing protein n=1 Tax=Scophthalmus maximus TaxID=52904 RepID=A0A6A4SBB3_SCOMX|nr:hypothetical protein F2P81_019468 [Scophthalmus maximus]